MRAERVERVVRVVRVVRVARVARVQSASVQRKGCRGCRSVESVEGVQRVQAVQRVEGTRRAMRGRGGASRERHSTRLQRSDGALLLLQLLRLPGRLRLQHATVCYYSEVGVPLSCLAAFAGSTAAALVRVRVAVRLGCLPPTCSTAVALVRSSSRSAVTSRSPAATCAPDCGEKLGAS